MDETQHFCLRWNNYQSSITSAFENLRDDEDFVDVTLACEGRSIKAHRVVLSACSPYFRDLLKSTPCKHPVILLQDVNFLDLHSLVEFIYHGEVNVHQKSLQSFLKTAEVLRVSGLTQQQAEETHSQLAQIHNLANTAAAAAAAIGRTSINTHHTSVHDDVPLYPRMQAASPPPQQQLPMASQHINSQFFKRSFQTAAMLRRNSTTPSGGDNANPLKRIRSTSATGIATVGDNGLSSSHNNSPDMLHQQSSSPQLTPADFSSTMKNNNNVTPPLKEEKRNGPTGNGNGLTSGSEKLGSLTPSPLARSADDVKAEPMELVCSNNNQNSAACDEHSNDSTGEHDANRSSSADGGKGSLSSGNDEEIENSLPSHQPPPFLTMSPADPKLFASAGFTFPMPLDSSTLAGFNAQMPTPADLAASPQGNQHHNALRSSATSPSSSASAPPSPPTDLTSPTNGTNGGSSMSALNMHASPPHLKGEAVNGNMVTPTATAPLRMPPPTSGGINEPQECPYCRRTFSCYYSLKRHFQDKHEQSDTLYVCEFCHRRYRTKNSLTTHKSLQHRGSSGMLKRLLKTSAIKNVLVPHHHAHHTHHHHHASLTHVHPANLFDFTSELGQPPPGIQ